jgi:nucleoside-diphosphate-sugar epimerase
MKSILILGGTGTISTPITLRLAKDPQVKVTLINRGHHNEKLDPAIELLIADINDPESIRPLIKDRFFDCVIDFILFTPSQSLSRIDLFTGKTKQFIFISTVACLDHEHHLIINEDTPRGNRFSHYGQNKAAAELILLDAHQRHGFPLTIVRPAQTYSETRIPLSVKGNSAWPVIQRMIQGKEVLIHGDGESVWASTHADDFASGFIPLINHPDAIGEIIQIMNPAPHTWNEVYRILATQLKVEFKPIYVTSEKLSRYTEYDFKTSIQGDKMFSNLYDIAKLKRFVPEFEPHVSLEMGLKAYLALMEAHPELKESEPEFDRFCDTLIAQKRNTNQLG